MTRGCPVHLADHHDVSAVPVATPHALGARLVGRSAGRASPDASRRAASPGSHGRRAA